MINVLFNNLYWIFGFFYKLPTYGNRAFLQTSLRCRFRISDFHTGRNVKVRITRALRSAFVSFFFALCLSQSFSFWKSEFFLPARFHFRLTNHQFPLVGYLFDVDIFVARQACLLLANQVCLQCHRYLSMAEVVQTCSGVSTSSLSSLIDHESRDMFSRTLTFLGQDLPRTVLYPSTSLKSNSKINGFIDRITIKLRIGQRENELKQTLYASQFC